MRSYLPALVVDSILVVVFSLILSSIDSGENARDWWFLSGEAWSGVPAAGWPFLCGLAVGWLALFAIRRDGLDPLSFPTGFVAWLSTVVVGTELAAISDQSGDAATLVLAISLLGPLLLLWRPLWRYYWKPQIEH